MADEKVTQLTADTTPTTDDLTYVINAPGSTPASRKSTLGEIMAAIWPATTNAATAKAAAIAADLLSIVDTAASNVIKKVTVTQLLAPLGEIIAAYTAKSLPASTDSVVISDAADSGVAKNVLLSVLHKALGMGLRPGQGATLTIAAGSITPTHRFHRVDTEAAAAADDLDTVVTTNALPGDSLTLMQVSNARDVTYKDGTGNMNLSADFVGSNSADLIEIHLGETTWFEKGTSNNA